VSTTAPPPRLVPGADAPVDFVAPTTPIDLTNCDREPIHIPGAVQPYGALLALDAELRVAQASESVAAHLGVEARETVGMELARVIGPGAAERVGALMPAEEGERAFARVAAVPAEGGERAFDATLHRSGGLGVLELEPASEEGQVGPERFAGALRAIVRRLDRADTLAELAGGVADEMRALTGFDRVWVYRFHEDWHGEIIGESKGEGIESWLGLHYPASDIPAQARALFLRNWVRAIPDVGFAPSPLVPADNPLTARPLDLGNSLLRSVSPIHVQYLTNMGVRGSLVISLIHRGRLWGLISGHHYAGPRHVPSGVRSLCEFLAQALSLQVGAMDRLEDRDHALRVAACLGRLVARLGDEAPTEQVLAAEPEALLGVAGAGGAAVLRGESLLRVGATPGEAAVRALAEWLRGRGDDLFESSRLAADFAPAAAWAEVASGVLALPLARDLRDWVLWFRGERRQTIRWAGDPRKPVRVAPDGTARLHPRGSFALWEQEVSGTSAPWRGVELQAALDLRRAVQDRLVRRAEEIAQLNRELALANAQLEETAVELEVQAEELMEQREQREAALERERDARAEAEGANRAKADFLAVMSHELRTPLNAIGGYAEIMSMGMRGPVTPEQLADLERIAVNQRHLLGLINSILNYSKLEAGQVQFSLERLPLRWMLHGLDALVGPQMRAKELTLRVDDCGDEVAVRADEEKLRQILLNLLTNALKFTPAGGTVSVGCEAGGETVTIRVRDTGRGIAPAHLEQVFEPFVQVDRHVTPGKDQGVGLGLAISRELARGMGGDLTAESELGRGSTFILTLPADPG